MLLLALLKEQSMAVLLDVLVYIEDVFLVLLLFQNLKKNHKNMHQSFLAHLLETVFEWQIPMPTHGTELPLFE